LIAKFTDKVVDDEHGSLCHDRALMTEFARYPSLAGRTAFVSGGASGLGAEFVAQLAAQGATVAFVDVDDAAGRALATEIARRGHPEPHFQVVDVREVEALTVAIDSVAERFGPVTILVNNAANDTRDEIEDIDVDVWDDRVAVNVRHHFFAARAVAPMMRQAGRGSIINLGSISAHAGQRIRSGWHPRQLHCSWVGDDAASTRELGRRGREGAHPRQSVPSASPLPGRCCQAYAVACGR